MSCLNGPTMQNNFQGVTRVETDEFFFQIIFYIIVHVKNIFPTFQVNRCKILHASRQLLSSCFSFFLRSLLVAFCF